MLKPCPCLWYVSLSAACMRINYTSGLDFLAIDRGQTGIPVGLKSADSLAHQDQDAGAGLYWAIWDEATQGYRQTSSMYMYQVKLQHG